MTVKTYNSCCPKKGFREVYHFDKKGNAIKSLRYYKQKHLSSYVYEYDKKDNLTREVQTYDINNKNPVYTTEYFYDYDSINRLVLRRKLYNTWETKVLFSNFDSNDNAQTLTEIFNQRTLIEKRTFDTKNRVVEVKRFRSDSLIFEEEMRYNEHDDLIYSHIPTYLDNETGKMIILIGGDRHSVTEEYEYLYDDQARWIKKYVLYDNKRVLLEKRHYKE